MTYDPMTEPNWHANRERIARSLERMVSRLRTPGMRPEITRYINALSERADKPSEYIAEAVEDARHDLMLIAGIGDALESANKGMNNEP